MSRGSVMVPAKLPSPVVALASCSSPLPKSTESVTVAPSGQPLAVTVTLPPAVAVAGVNCIAGAPPLGCTAAVVVAVATVVVVVVVVVVAVAGVVMAVAVAGVGVSDEATVGVAVGMGGVAVGT